MNHLKTLRPAAYALLGMIGLTLSSAQAQLTVNMIQNPVNAYNAFAAGVAPYLVGGQAAPSQQAANQFAAIYRGVSPDPDPLLNNAPFATINDVNIDPVLGAQLFNQLTPGLYTELPTILFNSANIQNTQIQQRLWAVRAGMAEDQTAPVADGGKSATVSGKKVVAPAMEADQKWVTFIDGNGIWSQAQSINNLPGYNTYGGGVQIGASREITKDLSFGPYIGYQGTRVSYNTINGGNSAATINSLRYGLFSEFRKGGWYTDGIIGGAYNSANVTHGYNIPGYSAQANGTTAGGEFDTMLGTGYEFKAGKLTFGPMSSLQYTYLQLGSVSEKNAGILNQNINSQNAASVLGTLGGQAHYDINLTQSVILQPYGSFAWQHEFMQNNYNVGSQILGQNYNFQTMNPGRDQFIAGIGGNLVFSKSISAYAVANLINGDQKIFSQAISGGINWKF
jgi:outer membrane autotransporter protein